MRKNGVAGGEEVGGQPAGEQGQVFRRVVAAGRLPGAGGQTARGAQSERPAQGTARRHAAAVAQSARAPALLRRKTGDQAAAELADHRCRSHGPVAVTVARHLQTHAGQSH